MKQRITCPPLRTKAIGLMTVAATKETTVYGIFTTSPGKDKDTKVTQKVKRSKFPFKKTKDSKEKPCTPKAAEGGLLDLFYKDDRYKTATSS